MNKDNSLFEDILRQTDVVNVISSYINVIKKGRNFVALCPFHDDKSPSLMISKEKQIYKCFACGAGGNAITFVQNYEKIPFDQALRKAAEIAGIHDPRLEATKKPVFVDTTLSPLYRCLTDLVTYYQYGLTIDEGKQAQLYLANRNINSKIQEKFLVGYAPNDGASTINFLKQKGHSLKTIESIGILSGNLDNGYDRNHGRVMFPIANSEGQVVGFSARSIIKGEEPKYVNSPETKLFHKSSLLYNYHNAKRTARHDGYIYILEGFMDVFALDRIGIESAVAIMGTALTIEHTKQLKYLNVEIRLCLDGDNAGQSAMMKVIKLLDEQQLNYRIVANQGDARDPDDILQENGPEALKKYLNQLISKAEFALNYYRSTNDLVTFEDRRKLILDFMPILLHSKSILETEDYLLKLSGATKFEYSVIKNLYETAKSKQTKGESIQMEDIRPEQKLLKRFQLAEREIVIQMLKDRRAIEFYTEKIGYFYHDIYNAIAQYMVDYQSHHDQIHVSEIIGDISITDLPNKEEVLNEITTLSMERGHPPFSEAQFNEYYQTIVEERSRLNDKDGLARAIAGKPPIEQAKIIKDYYERRQNTKATTKGD